MMKNTLSCLLLILTVTILNGQSFTSSNMNVFITPNVSSSDVGDYDNDGDLDIILIGSDNGGSHLKIYSNDGSGNFSLSTITFDDVYRNGQVEFIDFDNDNDLDVFVSGWNNSTEKSALYKNNSGDFVEILSPFAQNISNSQFGWSDLDNDGDLDLVLSGNYQTIDDYIYVYRNDSNDIFTLMSTSILAHSQGKTLIGDLDNDGDNDIVIGGLTVSNFEGSLQVYRNNGNFNFTLESTLERFINGDSELRDCNGDGFLDITKTGFASSVSVSTKIYFNNGNFTFTDFDGMSSFPVANHMNFVSADYTGNGELDFLLTVNNRASIFVNDGNMNLSEMNSTGIPSGSHDDIEVADFDGDHDVDIFLMNNNECRTYMNQSITSNTIPLEPSNLNAQVTGNSVELSWSRATDLETPNNQLNYNIYVGSSPMSTDIVTPSANINTGYRRIITIGNAQYKTNYKLNNLAIGTYYWSVQSIDNQYEGSLFAPEQTFSIVSLDVEEFGQQAITLYPNPVYNILNIDTKIKDYNIYIINALGQEVLKFNKSKFSQLDLSVLNSGLYFVKIIKNNQERNIKFYKL